MIKVTTVVSFQVRSSVLPLGTEIFCDTGEECEMVRKVLQEMENEAFIQRCADVDVGAGERHC